VRTQARFLLVGLAALAYTGLALGQGAPAHGWFWYQDPPPPAASAPKKAAPKPPAPKPKLAPKPAPEASGPKPLSVEWIRKELPQYMDRAIDNPTPEHVAEYLALQKLMFDKAQNFAAASVQARMEYPALSEATFVPEGGATLNNLKAYVREVRPVALKKVFDKAGLFFIFDSTCAFCAQEDSQLGIIKQDFPNVRFFNVSADSKPLPELAQAGIPVYPDNGIIKKWHIQIYPTVALVWPPNNVVLIAQGERDAAEIEGDILHASVKYGLLPAGYKQWIDPYERGTMTTEQIKSMQQDANPSPVQLLQGVSTNTMNTLYSTHQNQP
jgi:conjugal transfer pilus assembly protein TraF